MDDFHETGSMLCGKRKHEEAGPMPRRTPSSLIDGDLLLPESATDAAASHSANDADELPTLGDLFDDDEPPLLENDRVYQEAMRQQMALPAASSEGPLPRRRRTTSGVSAILDVLEDNPQSTRGPPLTAGEEVRTASGASLTTQDEVRQAGEPSSSATTEERCARASSGPVDDEVPPESSMPSQASGHLPAECLSLVTVEESGAQFPESIPQRRADSGVEEASTPRSSKSNSKGRPVEARVAGCGSSWKRFPSLKQAQDGTGIPVDQVKRICEVQCDYLGWEFRWPEVDESAKDTPGDTCDIAALAQRIRKVPSAARRRLVAFLPEATRTALSEHLKAPQPSPEMRPAAPPATDLNAIIADLPQVLRSVPQEARCKVLAGVRDLGARYRAMLLAPDIATVARLLAEVMPVQRRTLLEALPEDTQQALTEHMLAKRAADSNKSSKNAEDNKSRENSKAITPCNA